MRFNCPDGNRTVFEHRLFADRIGFISGGFVGGGAVPPQFVPVDGHEEQPPGNGGIDSYGPPGATMAAENLDVRAVLKPLFLGVGGMHLHIRAGIELIEVCDRSGLGTGVPLIGRAAGGEDQRELHIRLLLAV